MSNSLASPALLLANARAGDSEALSQLLALYRNYLALLARARISSALRVRIDSSDVVQETLMEAYRDFAQFAGSSEGQLMVWLRKILANNLANQARHHHAQKRAVDRQRSLQEELDRSSLNMERFLAAEISSPSQRASQRERSVILSDALARLPSDYREVLVMRHMEDAKFDTIAERMDRSPGAARMLWVRALEQLRKEMEVLG